MCCRLIKDILQILVTVFRLFQIAFCNINCCVDTLKLLRISISCIVDSGTTFFYVTPAIFVSRYLVLAHVRWLHEQLILPCRVSY